MTEIYSDAELYDLILNRDKAGFDYLYDKYCGFLYGLIVHSVGSEHYAEEILELAFVNAWNSIPLFTSLQIKLNLWMVSVLIRTVKDYLDSRNITYIFMSTNFPLFSFEFPEERIPSLHLAPVL